MSASLYGPDVAPTTPACQNPDGGVLRSFLARTRADVAPEKGRTIGSMRRREPGSTLLDANARHLDPAAEREGGCLTDGSRRAPSLGEKCTEHDVDLRRVAEILKRHIDEYEFFWRKPG